MLAKLHPLIVHLPIGMILLACIAGWASNRADMQGIRKAMPFVWLLAGLSALLAVLTGWLLGAQSVQSEALTWHQWTNIALCGVVLLFAFVEWKMNLHTSARNWLLFVPFVMLLNGTYSGASLTHGAGFLWASDGSDAVFAEESATVAAADVPKEEPPAADPKALLALRQKGALIMPVSASSNWLSVNCVNAPTFSNADAALLQPLAAQIVWLRLSDTQISDTALTSIGRLTQLTRLYLDNTQIKGTGLKDLVGLKSLRLLNLSGTPVTANSLEPLAALPALQTVYLFGNHFDNGTYQGLVQTFKIVKIDTGGYIVPTLTSDTSRLKAAKSYE